MVFGPVVVGMQLLSSEHHGWRRTLKGAHRSCPHVGCLTRCFTQTLTWVLLWREYDSADITVALSPLILEGSDPRWT